MLWSRRRRRRATRRRWRGGAGRGWIGCAAGKPGRTRRAAREARPRRERPAMREEEQESVLIVFAGKLVEREPDAQVAGTSSLPRATSPRRRSRCRARACAVAPSPTPPGSQPRLCGPPAGRPARAARRTRRRPRGPGRRRRRGATRRWSARLACGGGRLGRARSRGSAGPRGWRTRVRKGREGTARSRRATLFRSRGTVSLILESCKDAQRGM